MDSCIKEGFLSKAKWIFSSLTGIIILWASRFPLSPMQIPKQVHSRLQTSGLKTLIYSQGHPLQNPNHRSLEITSHMISSQSQSPSPASSLFRSSTNSSWCSAIDDFLGTESGVYMNSDNDEHEMTGLQSEEDNNNRYQLAKGRSQHCTNTMMIKEYPPPLSHTPRVLTRHYENGNLVLKYDKGMQHYFEITRENGRLILNLVQLEDNNNEDQLKLQGTNEPMKEEKETEADDDETTTHYEEGSIMIVAASQKMPKWCLEDEELGRKCFTYTGRRSTECVTNFGQLLPGSAPLAVTARRVTPVM